MTNRGTSAGAPALRVIKPDDYVISPREIARLKAPLLALHLIEPTGEEMRSNLPSKKDDEPMTTPEHLRDFKRQVAILKREGATDEQIVEAVGGKFTQERMVDILKTAEASELLAEGKRGRR